MFFDGLDIHYETPLIDFDLRHISNQKHAVQLLEVILWIVLTLPTLGLPFWLGLADGRWKILLLKYLIYLYEAVFLYMTLAGLYLIISALQLRLPIFSAVLYEVYFLSQAGLILLAVIFLRNRTSKEWSTNIERSAFLKKSAQKTFAPWCLWHLPVMAGSMPASWPVRFVCFLRLKLFWPGVGVPPFFQKSDLFFLDFLK
jgi:hypothetical protein